AIGHPRRCQEVTRPEREEKDRPPRIVPCRTRSDRRVRRGRDEASQPRRPWWPSESRSIPQATTVWMAAPHHIDPVLRLSVPATQSATMAPRHSANGFSKWIIVYGTSDAQTAV